MSERHSWSSSSVNQLRVNWSQPYHGRIYKTLGVKVEAHRTQSSQFLHVLSQLRNEYGMQLLCTSVALI
jgi:hypothetical protein